MTPQPPFGHVSGEKHGLKGYIHPVFTAPLFTISQDMETLIVHPQMDGQRRYGKYIKWNIAQKE